MTLIPPKLKARLEDRFKLWHAIVLFTLTVFGVVYAGASQWVTVTKTVEQNAARSTENRRLIEDRTKEIKADVGTVSDKMDKALERLSSIEGELKRIK